MQYIERSLIKELQLDLMIYKGEQDGKQKGKSIQVAL